jgi:hypothetical protein
MEEINIIKNEKHSYSGELFKIEPDKVYEFSANVICSKGKEKCAFLAMFFLDENEIVHRMKFISDFSGKETEYKIISAVPLGAKFVKLGYRINEEGAIQLMLK